MTCKDIEELSGAYVLDAVTDEERQAVDAHLATCQHCTQLIQELRSVVDLLPFTVPQADLSPTLKDRIMAAIADEKAAAIPLVQAKPSVRPRRRSVWQRWSTQLIAVAAILFFLISGGLTAWNVSLQHQLSALVANAPVTYTIQGTTASHGITGQVMYFPQQHTTVISVYGLPRTQGVQVYQGWLLQGNGQISIGLLNVQNGVATIDYPGDVQHYAAAAVSLEAGPSATQVAPKGPVVAIGSFSKSV